MNISHQVYQFTHLSFTTQVEEQWRYVATIIDRLFFWIFTIVGTVGTAFLILQAPGLYDTSEPIDIKLSKMGPKIRPQIFP